MIRLVHTADIHIGMENYGKVDPQTGIHTRLLDFQATLHQCIDRAIHDDIDAFIFAGDAYKTAQPTPTHQRILCEAFLRLARAHIPVVMVIGNHDHPFHMGKTHALDIFRQMPIPAMHVIHKPEKIVLATKRGPLQIVGIPWPSRAMLATRTELALCDQATITRHISHAVADIIKDLAASCDPSVPAILMGHLTVSTGIFSGSEKRAMTGNDPTLMPSQLAIAPFDYVALGHLHRYQDLNRSGYPSVVYSGSLERIDFGERHEEKGFCRVDIPAKGQAQHTFCPVGTRPCVQIDVVLDAARTAVSGGATAQILQAIAERSIAQAIVKITYQVPPGMKDTVDKHAVLHACRAAHYVAGVIPQFQHAPRTGRARFTVDTTPADRLRLFAHSQQIEGERLERILAKASQLEIEDGL